MSKLQQLIEAAKAATPGPWEWIDPIHDLPWSGTGFASLHTVKKYGEDKTELRDGLHYTSFALPKFVCDAESLESVEDAIFIALANPATILELCALLKKAEEALLSEDAQTNEGLRCAISIEALIAIKQWKEKA